MTNQPLPLLKLCVRRSVVSDRESVCVKCEWGPGCSDALSYGDIFVMQNNRNEVVDVNHFHVSLTHIRLNILRGTAHQSFCW